MSLEVNDVTAGYGKITVLRNITFGIRDGQIVGLLGRNGMGKTTLIRCLAGLIIPTSGTLFYDGADITQLPPHERARRGITTVVQGRGVFPGLTVRENLEMGRIASSRKKRSRYDEVLGYFPRLAERLDQAAGTMSGGEQQMLAIGRGLMGEPRLLILDEPSLGLSPLLVEELFGLVAQLHAEHLSILLVEQNVAQSLEIAQRAYVMENGAIQFSGSSAELLATDRLRQAYLGV